MQLARESTYEGRKALLEKEYKEARLTKEQLNIELRKLDVEFYDFTQVSAQENLDFLKNMTDEELNEYIRKLDLEMIMEKDYTEKLKIEEQKRQAETFKRMDAIEEKTKSWEERMKDVMNSIGQSISQGAESWKEYGKSIVEALKQAIIMIIKEGVAITVLNALKKYKVDPFVAIGLSALAGGLAAGVFSTALNTISIPGLANEGAVYGPTLLRAGEYPGASSDPEHFIRQSHLESLVERVHGGREQLVARVRGRDLDFVLEEEHGTRSRMS
jgi:hypothetical protein